MLSRLILLSLRGVQWLKPRTRLIWPRLVSTAGRRRDLCMVPF